MRGCAEAGEIQGRWGHRTGNVISVCAEGSILMTSTQELKKELQ